MSVSPRLIWVMQCHTGKKNLRGESNFILYTDMAKVFSSLGDFVYFLIPHWSRDQELETIDHVKYVRIHKVDSFYNGLADFDPTLYDLFNRRGGRYFSDVLMTSSPAVIPYMSALLCDIGEGGIPTICFEPGVSDKFARVEGSIVISRLCVFGYSLARTIFLTMNEKMVALEYAMKWMSPSEVKRIDERSIVAAVGVPTDILKRYVGRPKNPVFTLFFGARVNAVKNVDEIVELYDKLYASGLNLKIVICTSTPDMLAMRYIGKELFSKNKNIELYTDMNREQYLELASRAHVFVANSDREGFPVGFWEQMYIGLIGLFRKRPWSLSQIPHDYPYIFNNLTEAAVMIADLYGHYEERVKVLDGIKQIVDTKYQAGRMYAQFRELAIEETQSAKKPGSPTVNLMKECIEKLGNTFTLNGLKAMMAEKGRVFRKQRRARVNALRYSSDYQIHFGLHRLLGFDFKYDIESGEVLYEKI